MASMSATVAGVTPTVEHGSLTCSQDIGRRSTADMVILDYTRGTHYNWGTPVTVYDSNGNAAFGGFVESASEKLDGNPETWMIRHTLTVKDYHYLADKRRAAKVYSNQAAGAIVSDLVNTYLAAEGVIGANYSLSYTSQADFNGWTLTRVSATTNNTGDIEQTYPTAPSLSRASIGYASTGGASVASNTPRYETQGGRQGFWVEIGATNLLSANQSDVETDTTGFSTVGTGTTITRDTGAGNFYFNTAGIKTVTTLGGGAGAGVVTSNIAGTAGQVYQGSVWVKGTNGDLLKLVVKDNTNGVTTTVNFTATGAWQRLTGALTYGVTGGTGLQLKVLNQNAGANTFYCDGWQLETTAYPTNWQVGGTARANESFTLPVAATGANPSYGTFAAWVYVTNATKDTSETRWLFDARNSGASTNQLNIQRSTGGQWQIGTANGASGVADATAVGWHRFVLTWGGGTYTLYIDGAQVAQRVNQPNATGIDTVRLGSRYTGGSGWANALFSDVRFEDYQWSSAVVTSDYAANGFTTIGANTILYFGGHGNLTTGAGGYAQIAIDASRVGWVANNPTLIATLNNGSGGAATIQYAIGAGAYQSANGSNQMTAYNGLDLGDGVHGTLNLQVTLTQPNIANATPHCDDVAVAFTTTQIAAGATVIGATFNYARVSDCIQALADKAGFIWYIDQFRHLWFYAPGAVAGPTITSAQMIDDSIDVTHTNPIYRNRQFITNISAQTSSQTETRKGDGSTKAFTMSYPLSATPTITVNGSAKTVGIKGVNSSGFDFYWSLGDPVIAQDNAGTTLISTDTLSVTYVGQYTAIVQSDDSHQQSLQKGIELIGSGIVEDAMSAAEVASINEAIQLANGQLSKFSATGKQVTFDTTVSGFTPGQLATVTIAEHGITAEQMLVESVVLRDHLYGDQDFTATYTITAVEGPANTDWATFWTTLITKGSNYIDSISLGANGTLVTNETLTENWSWTETVTETVYACPLVGTALVGSANVC